MLELYEEIEDNFLLFGIQSPVLDEAKFIYLLNSTFGWKLSRINDLDVTFENDTFCFSCFLYEFPHNQDDYIYVIKNKSHNKIDNITTETSLFSGTELTKSRLLLNKWDYNYLIKFPEEISNKQIQKLNTQVDFIYSIQQINQISKKEEKYFLI